MSGGIQDFLDCYTDLLLSDLHAKPLHTWWNSSDTKPLFKKLDKVLVNCDWLLKFHDLSYFYSSGSL